MCSIRARGTGVGKKARTELRDVIASSTVRATSAWSGGGGNGVPGASHMVAPSRLLQGAGNPAGWNRMLMLEYPAH
jgi:hypothetical protein